MSLAAGDRLERGGVGPRDAATAFAPASVGNVASGFDLLGHTLEGLGDRVTARRITQPRVEIETITGVVTGLPHAASENTAGRALMSLHAALDLGHGFAISIEKGIPLGSGLGGSAASAVAALVAANALLAAPLARAALYPHALAGEAVASGSPHGDNAGPQLLGGLVLALEDRLVSIPVPETIVAVVVHPHFVLETRRARAVLAGHYTLAEHVAQSARLAQLLAGCYTNDMALIAQGLVDTLVEPRRAPLVPGFARVRGAALDCGALGASLSGAGPSVFAWCPARAVAVAAGAAMRAAFAEAGLDSDVHVSAVRGPRAELVA
ncbi:MAG TPA: homoserine kinase [Candidatus Saccharimonadia bacterium]|nr:homoserine kinase [Candidatus Saccharimonadia bacterium]